MNRHNVYLTKIRKSSHAGFTLLELLTCCAIATTLGMLSIPVNKMVLTHRINAATTDLFHLIQAARTIALSNNRFVTICPTSNQTSCDASWSTGALAFLDKNANRMMEEDETIIYTITSDPKLLRLKWSAFGRKTNLTFTGEGFTDSQNGRFYICPTNRDNKLERQLIVHKSGRPRLASPNEYLDEKCQF